jgi:sterol desaturase/sphingolipid hydroxylase (fatty acid hydroxylase superfamily)
MEIIVVLTFLATLAVVERAPAVRYRVQPLLRAHFATDALYLWTGGILLSRAMQAGAIHWVEGRAAFAETLAAAPAWVVVPLAIVLHDLGGYVAHRLLHRFAPLWALHKVHHSSRELDWLATFRAHALEHALRHLLSPVLLIAIGFPLASVAVAAAVNAIFAALAHANVGLRLSWLEPLFITPRLHRLHHVAASCERNFGAMLSVWDRLLGTLLVDPEAKVEPIGVPGEIETYPQSWPAQLVEPFRALARPRGAPAPDPSMLRRSLVGTWRPEPAPDPRARASFPGST